MGRSNGNGKPPSTSDRTIAELLSMRYRIPTINLDEYEVAPAIIALVPRDVCERLIVLPVSRSGRSLIVAVARPADSDVEPALAKLTGYTIEKVVAGEEAIRAAIRKYYGDRD